MADTDPSPTFHPDATCPVCGYRLYSTDQDNYEITYYCSSPEARFWDYDRGTPEQNHSKDHWDRSRREIILHRDDLHRDK
jgi:hypothetical protein